MLMPAVVVVTSYLVGAIPFGYVVAWARGVDLLHQGSGNIGATNVGRVLGWKFGVLVFLLDFAKGAGPVLAADLLFELGSDLGADELRVAAGLAAFLGHLFPVYLGFRGGKGVATGAGVVAVLVPGPAAGAVFLWAAVLCSTRYMSLASLSAAAALCLLRLGFTRAPFSPENRTLTYFCLVAAVLVGVRHQANIGRLIRGCENRLRDSSTMFRASKILHVLAVGLWFGTVIFFFVTTAVLFSAFGAQTVGSTVGPLFDVYFPLQVGCGVVAVITALAWLRAGRLHRYRVAVLSAALATAIAGWPLAQHVKALRLDRVSPDREVAAQAEAVFGRWHNYSMLLNCVTMVLVTAGMALAAFLPERGVGGEEPPPPQPPTPPPSGA